jgi:transposase
MIEQMDIIEILMPTGHCACGADLAAQPAVLKKRRQQVEIPEPKTIVTDYRQMRVTYCCGLEQCGEFPAGVTSTVSVGCTLQQLHPTFITVCMKSADISRWM